MSVREDDSERGSLTVFSGYFTKAHRTGNKLSYLNSKSDTLQKPEEGLLALYVAALYKGGYRQKSHNSLAYFLKLTAAYPTTLDVSPVMSPLVL